MGALLTNRTRPFKVLGSLPITSIRVTFSRVPKSQKVQPSQGIADYVGDTLVLPVSAKYSYLALVRWNGSDGVVKGIEQEIDFLDTQLYPPSTDCTGFEIYVKSGAVFKVQINGGDAVFRPEDYYLKSEVNAFLATKRGVTESPTYAELTSEIYQVQADAFYYTDDHIRINNLKQGFTYRQALALDTATLTNGETWREIDGSGNIVMDWVWNSTNSKWQSIALHSLQAINPGITANANFYFAGVGYHPSYSIRLASQQNLLFVATTNNSTNYWTYQLQTFGTNANVGAVVSTGAIAANATIQQQQTLTNVVAYSASQGFLLGFTKVGTPGSLYSLHTLKYRYER